MQQFTTTLFCIAILLINSVSVSAHTFETVGFHAHTYLDSDEDDVINDGSDNESLQSCYCPDCFYSENANSSVSLAIVALSSWIVPVTIESDNFAEMFVILKRSIPPDDRPPIAFVLHT